MPAKARQLVLVGIIAEAWHQLAEPRVEDLVNNLGKVAVAPAGGAT